MILGPREGDAPPLHLISLPPSLTVALSYFINTNDHE
jgi:hypothetical protein